ncbi:phage repressor protein [Pantoea sp. KXB25]|uniref:phage repressor protein n=1 Tax=unclassified Pantoea TaxID=2630326 RepID=UPI003AB883F1
MGFPSPAQDFVESRLDLNKLFAPHPDNMIRIETPTGFALVDRSLTPAPGDTVAFQHDDYPQLGKLFRSGIITQDGETIDGEGLEGIIVLGKVTAEILALYEPRRPTI